MYKELRSVISGRRYRKADYDISSSWSSKLLHRGARGSLIDERMTAVCGCLSSRSTKGAGEVESFSCDPSKLKSMCSCIWMGRRSSQMILDVKHIRRKLVACRLPARSGSTGWSSRCRGTTAERIYSTRLIIFSSTFFFVYGSSTS